VAAGRADAGLGVLAAARTFGLDFVPAAHEPYELVTTQQAHDSALLVPLWALLADEKFRALIEGARRLLGTETGLRVFPR